MSSVESMNRLLWLNDNPTHMFAGVANKSAAILPLKQADNDAGVGRHVAVPRESAGLPIWQPLEFGIVWNQGRRRLVAHIGIQVLVQAV